MGGFEEYSSVMGGVLEVAGVPGFLRDADVMHGYVDLENQAFHAFLCVWYDTHGQKVTTVSELLPLAHELNLGEKSSSIRLGQMLHRHRGIVVNGLVLEDCGQRRGVRQYRLRVTQAKESKERLP